eukprot:1256371-Pyramimonas_sp.AAC.1
MPTVCATYSAIATAYFPYTFDRNARETPRSLLSCCASSGARLANAQCPVNRLSPRARRRSRRQFCRCRVYGVLNTATVVD